MMAGKSCTFTLPVTTQAAAISALNCGSAIFSPSALTQGTAYSGTLTVPYTGGNGGAYSQASFTSNGLSFLLPAGTLASGSGNLIYNVIGSPSVSGTMTIPISFAGNSCNVVATVATATTVVLPGNPQGWMRHNLGADTNLDPDVPVQAINGDYYQWGRPIAVATAYTSASFIPGWSDTSAADGSWADESKTSNDPCPSGFRVPTRQQWQNLLDNTTPSNVGTFTGSSTNFGAAKVFTAGGKKLTLPAAGQRGSMDGLLFYRSRLGSYWSSTKLVGSVNEFSYRLQFGDGTNINIAAPIRSYGFSIRCIAE